MNLAKPLLDIWSEVAMGRLSSHPDDAPLLNSRIHKLRLDRAPEPWFGIPSKAKIFYLTLNPGHASDEDGTLGMPWRNFCHDMMLERISRKRFFEEAPPSAIRWLRRAHGDYAETAFDQICNLRLLAYPSVDRSSFGDLSTRFLELATVRQTKEFVHRELVPRAKRGELALLVLRGAEAWGFRPGREDIVEGSLFISKPVRGVSLTPRSRVSPVIHRLLNVRTQKASENEPSTVPDMSNASLNSSPRPLTADAATAANDMHRTSLWGDCTSEQIERFLHRVRGAKIRKLKPESCTYAMARRNSYIGGARYTIFEFFDREPTLREAVDYGRRQGMKVTGTMAYWDILEALRKGFIEIVDSSKVHGKSEPALRRVRDCRSGKIPAMNVNDVLRHL